MSTNLSINSQFAKCFFKKMFELGRFFLALPPTVAGNCGAAFGADTLSPKTKVSWKEILSKPKNQHHNCLLLSVARLSHMQYPFNGNCPQCGWAAIHIDKLRLRLECGA